MIRQIFSTAALFAIVSACQLDAVDEDLGSQMEQAQTDRNFLQKLVNPYNIQDTQPEGFLGKVKSGAAKLGLMGHDTRKKNACASQGNHFMNCMKKNSCCQWFDYGGEDTFDGFCGYDPLTCGIKWDSFEYRITEFDSKEEAKAARDRSVGWNQ